MPAVVPEDVSGTVDHGHDDVSTSASLFTASAARNFLPPSPACSCPDENEASTPYPVEQGTHRPERVTNSSPEWTTRNDGSESRRRSAPPRPCPAPDRSAAAICRELNPAMSALCTLARADVLQRPELRNLTGRHSYPSRRARPTPRSVFRGAAGAQVGARSQTRFRGRRASRKEHDLNQWTGVAAQKKLRASRFVGALSFTPGCDQGEARHARLSHQRRRPGV